MFLLSFALSIAIYTIWLNAKVGILISLVMCGILMTVSFFLKSNPRSIKHKTPYQQRGMSCLYSILGNMLAFAVICGNLQLRGKEYFNLFLSPSSCTEIQGVHSSERESFNGFGTIIDTQNYHVYLFEDENGKVWRLSTQQTYHIGDQLFLSASVKALDTKVIFDSTFLPPRTAAFRAYQFNYDKWIFMKGIDGTAYEKQAILVPEGGGRFTMAMSIPPEKKLGWIDRMRAGMQGYVEKVYGHNQYAGLLLGLLIGDKSLIPTEAYHTFVNSGLVHIIAVSGGNIAMVVILLSFLLKWVPLYVRNGLIILMIIIYAMICGGDSSVVRAAIMGCLTLIALFWGREVSIRRAMKYAFIGILLFSPFSLVYDVGLVLSFSAIIGIVLVQKITENGDVVVLSKRSKKRVVLQTVWKEYLTPTIGASLGTAPVLIFFMNGVNLVGIALNIVIIPIIPVITIYGFASLWLYAFVQRGGRVWIEMLLMKMVYGLSAFGETYAVFIQAKNVVAKYVLMVVFIGLAIWSYVKVMEEKNLEESKKKLTLEEPPKSD